MIHNPMIIKSGGGGTPEMVEVNVDGTTSDYPYTINYVDENGVIGRDSHNMYGTSHFFAQKNLGIQLDASVANVSVTGGTLESHPYVPEFYNITPTDDVVNITIYL